MLFELFQAFKFPDVMDLIIECSVDLCKKDCEMCPNPNQVRLVTFSYFVRFIAHVCRLTNPQGEIGS